MIDMLIEGHIAEIDNSAHDNYYRMIVKTRASNGHTIDCIICFTGVANVYPIRKANFKKHQHICIQAQTCGRKSCEIEFQSGDNEYHHRLFITNPQQVYPSHAIVSASLNAYS